MARKRMIHPCLWEDEHFGLLSDKAKLLFIACFSNADDFGRLNANPANIRAVAFRFEEISLQKTEELLFEISEKITHFKLYEVENIKYVWFEKWDFYQQQRAERKVDSRFPTFGGEMSAECQRNVSEMSAEVSLVKYSLDKYSLDKVSLVKGKKKNKKKEKQPKTLYLDFIYLTDEEYKKLVYEFGIKKTNELIETINNGVGAKGYIYQSHYHAIMAWERKDTKEQQTKTPDWIKSEKDSIDRANQERKADSHLPKELSTILTSLANDKDINNITKEKSVVKCADCKRPLNKVTGTIRQNKENGELICEFCYNLTQEDKNAGTNNL